jgi:hypothetical protein
MAIPDSAINDSKCVGLMSRGTSVARPAGVPHTEYTGSIETDVFNRICAAARSGS